jgi:type II restriction enzyme
MDNHYIADRIKTYKADPESVYNTWFLNNSERLKAFRTIKNGLTDVVRSIEARTFGNDYKGSPLEFVMSAICEQKQIFEGAAHAFYWKPKLRIPDIYENDIHQLAFGRFLKALLQASQEKQILEEIYKLDNMHIKGLGPAVANIIYFLHPTLFPPFNTAIVRGYNELLGQKIKLGSWTAYLEMREGLLQMNNEQRSLLSNDLGAVGGFVFEIGAGRLITSGNAERILESEAIKQEKTRLKRHTEIINDFREENAHSEMQYHLARLGRSLGYKVWIAQNDHKRQWNSAKLGEFSLPALPQLKVSKAAFDTISFIDVQGISRKPVRS